MGLCWRFLLDCTCDAPLLLNWLRTCDDVHVSPVPHSFHTSTLWLLESDALCAKCHVTLEDWEQFPCRALDAIEHATGGPKFFHSDCPVRLDSVWTRLVSVEAGKVSWKGTKRARKKRMRRRIVISFITCTATHTQAESMLYIMHKEFLCLCATRSSSPCSCSSSTVHGRLLTMGGNVHPRFDVQHFREGAPA